MTHSYPLYFHKKHIHVNLPEGAFIVDTGSPVSYSETGAITYCGTKHTKASAPFIKTLNQKFGTQCIGILGADLLSTRSVFLDLTKEGQMTVGSECPLGLMPYKFELSEDKYIILEGALNHGPAVVKKDYYADFQLARFIWDTGAQYGYTSDKTNNLCSTKGSLIDWNPHLGDIVAENSWIIPVVFKQDDFNFIRDHMAYAEVVTKQILEPHKVNAILSNSWMMGTLVWFDYASQKVAIKTANHFNIPN